LTDNVILDTQGAQIKLKTYQLLGNHTKGESNILLSKWFKNIALYLPVLRILFIVLHWTPT